MVVRVARKLPYARRVVWWVRAWWEDWCREHARSTKNITRSNTLRAYNRVYESDQLLAEYLGPDRLRFYDEVAIHCAELAPRSVIDVGCGPGQLLRTLVGRLPDAPEVVVGLDRSKTGIRRARAAMPDGEWLVGDLFRLPADMRQFDLVLSTEVLEHVRRPGSAVEILRRLCAPGGRVAITVPDGAQDSWKGHVNFWSEDELRQFLQPQGLIELERIQDGDVFLAWLAPPETY